MMNAYSSPLSDPKFIVSLIGAVAFFAFVIKDKIDNRNK